MAIVTVNFVMIFMNELADMNTTQTVRIFDITAPGRTYTEFRTRESRKSKWGQR